MHQEIKIGEQGFNYKMDMEIWKRENLFMEEGYPLKVWWFYWYEPSFQFKDVYKC